MRWLLLSALLLSIGCLPKKVGRNESLIPARAPMKLGDDLPLYTLADALDGQIARIESVEKPLTPYIFGERELTKAEHLAGLRHLRDLARNSRDREAFLAAVERDFAFYEVYGNKRQGGAFLTSYFEPVIPASRQQTEKFRAPLLKRPDDLLEIAIDEYDARFSEIRRMRGRISEKLTVTGNRQIVPYFTREEISTKGALAGRGLELGWVDPIDGFTLEIQGSGTLEFEDGTRLRLGYSDQNGHLYQAIGKYLTDFIPIEQMTMIRIEAYLRTLPEADAAGFLNMNPSYVFFQEQKGDPLTTLGVPATPGRTIATDTRMFPKGAVAYLSFAKPQLGGEGGAEAMNWISTGRFVLDQDSGGAIRGPARLDLFWGRGAEAKTYASLMKQGVRLYYLAPKPEWLAANSTGG